MPILNLTQHMGTPEQGVIEPGNKALVKELLTFTTMPSREDIDARAIELADLANGHWVEDKDNFAMVGGAPYLIPYLVAALKARGFRVLFAYSERVSEEKVLDDGSVEKVNVFKHKGWVEV